MLAVPGSGVTVLNLNHEINLFGSCTNVYTTEVLCYPSIQDEPTQLKVEKDDGWMWNLATGVLVTAVFAGLAVCTGGAAAVILAGAALGSAAVTAGATYSDIKSGHSRSIGEFAFQLANGAAIGATSAALVGEIVMTLPAASVAAGVEASLIAGNTSVFTAVTVPQLATVGGSGVAAANVMIGLNEAFAIGSGTNVMLETVFDGDVEAYDTAAMMISMLGFAIIQYGISNVALAPNKNKSSKNGVNLETKSESGSNAIEIGKTDLDNLRTKLNVPETDTIAVGKTDIPGFENVIFEGESPKVRNEAGLQDIDIIWPNRNIKAPGNNPLFTRHAEEVVANNFDMKITNAGLNPKDVSGTLKIHQSNPTGVCRKCIQGLANDNVSPGVLKQLSLKYPNLTIQVSSESVPGVRVTGRSNFVIRNGKYVE